MSRQLTCSEGTIVQHVSPSSLRAHAASFRFPAALVPSIVALNCNNVVKLSDVVRKRCTYLDSLRSTIIAFIFGFAVAMVW